jgi:hypothetical protein
MRWRASKQDEVVDLERRLASYTVAPRERVVLPPDSDSPETISDEGSDERSHEFADRAAVRSTTVRLPDVADRRPDPQPVGRRSGRHRRRPS